ncbi:MAG: hypothetical protein AAB657_03360 [Patescibacteria group bacterium]
MITYPFIREILIINISQTIVLAVASNEKLPRIVPHRVMMMLTGMSIGITLIACYHLLSESGYIDHMIFWLILPLIFSLFFCWVSYAFIRDDENSNNIPYLAIWMAATVIFNLFNYAGQNIIIGAVMSFMWISSTYLVLKMGSSKVTT